MTMNRSFVRYAAWVALLGCVASAAAYAAEEKKATQDKETKLVATLQSNAPPAEKAAACKQLAIYGSQTAAPALAPLLADERLASWARIALEAIPGPACDEVLREAAAKLQGKLAIGAINSLARRLDAKSVEVLVVRMKDPDAEVASAAAAGLGRIGGEGAVKALELSLASAPAAVRSAVAEGCILSAEKYLAEGKADQAVKLYDMVRKAEVPKPRVLEATRGAILARGEAGAPLLVEQLKSTDKAFFGIGLRTAREMTCPGATAAVAAELEKASPARQVLLLSALADRGDVKAAPAAAKLAASEDAEIRLAALAALGRLGDATHIEVLLAAAGKDPAQMPIVREALKRLPGAGVNAALVARARTGQADQRAEAILALSARSAAEGVPVFMEALAAGEEATRQNAVIALRQLAGMAEYPDLLARLVKSDSPETRRALQDVLVAVSRRSDQPAQCAQQLMEAWKSTKGDARMNLLEIICWFGRPETLEAVKEGLQAKDAETRKSVLRSLANWPDSGIVPQLAELARTDDDAAVKVLALRTAIPLAARDAALAPADKAARLGNLMKLAQRIEEKKLVLGELKNAPCAASLLLAAELLAEPKAVNEAAQAISELASQKTLRASPEEVQAVTKKIDEANVNPALKQRLKGQLKGVKAK